MYHVFMLQNVNFSNKSYELAIDKTVCNEARNFKHLLLVNTPQKNNFASWTQPLWAIAPMY
jgi:hypothetical protein